MDSESILATIRDRVVGSVEEKTFDNDLIMHINSAFSDLQGIGVGPVQGFEIEDDMSTWDEFNDEPSVINSVKEFVYLTVKLAFDPPTQAALLASMEKRLAKLEWNLNVKCDST